MVKKATWYEVKLEARLATSWGVGRIFESALKGVKVVK